MWDHFYITFISEFSNFADLSEVLRVIIRLVVAGFLGGLLGYERERRLKDAGIRTHMLVAVGTALFVIGPLQSGASLNDVTRIMQGVVQGIGFLGAGAIIVGTAQTKTRGLTTAASIWATAGIGMVAGLGMQSMAILSTLIILFILAVLPRVVYPGKNSPKKNMEE
jgi:putative Mg2+ transporter-C (MgtC) family protein